MSLTLIFVSETSLSVPKSGVEVVSVPHTEGRSMEVETQWTEVDSKEEHFDRRYFHRWSFPHFYFTPPFIHRGLTPFVTHSRPGDWEDFLVSVEKFDRKVFLYLLKLRGKVTERFVKVVDMALFHLQKARDRTARPRLARRVGLFCLNGDEKIIYYYRNLF